MFTSISKIEILIEYQTIPKTKALTFRAFSYTQAHTQYISRNIYTYIPNTSMKLTLKKNDVASFRSSIFCYVLLRKLYFN